MSSLPWPRFPLDQVAHVQTGIAKGKVLEGPVRSMPYLRVANVQDGFVDLHEIKCIDVTDDLASRYALQRDDVLFTEGGDADKLGRGCVWRGQIEPCLHQNHVFAVRADRERIVPKFLAYYAASPAGRTYFLTCAKQTTNLASINSTQLKALPVPIPPIREQQKIVAVLSAVDEAIEATKAVIAQLQVVKNAMMAELLTRGIPGRHTRFKQTEFGEMPESWRYCTVDSLGREGEKTVRSGPFGSSMKTDDFRDSGIPVITIQSLGDGRIEIDGLFYVDQEKNEQLESYKVIKNDLVFSRVADIGRCVAIEEAESGWLISPNVSRIRFDTDKASASFLMYVMTNNSLVSRQIGALSGNAGRQVISSLTLKQLLVPVPPLEEQLQIVRVARSAEERIDAERSFLVGLQSMKSTLLSALLSGEVRVTPDP